MALSGNIAPSRRLAKAPTSAKYQSRSTANVVAQKVAAALAKKQQQTAKKSSSPEQDTYLPNSYPLKIVRPTGTQIINPGYTQVQIGQTLVNVKRKTTKGKL